MMNKNRSEYPECGAKKTRYQFGVKIGRIVIDSDKGKPFTTEKQARNLIQRMEDADRVYDIPGESNRKVVVRKVTEWAVVQ